MTKLPFRKTDCTLCCWCGHDETKGDHVCTGEEPWANQCQKTSCPDHPHQQAKEIENFLNQARERINKEAGVELMPYKAKVIFTGKADD